jgi:hypothetical protein
MPDGLSGILPGLSLLSDQLGSAANFSNQSELNAKSRVWSEKMYEKQKFDARVNWGLQNDYNAPAAQMARFKAAGLNPNLIYGQGNPGNAGSIALADAQTPRFDSSRPGDAFSHAGDRFAQIYDTQMRKASLDNMKAQNTVIMEDAMLKHAQTLAVQAGTDTSRFRLDFENELRGVSGDARRESLRQLRINNDVALDSNVRAALKNATDLQEAGERMLSMQFQRGTGLLERERMRANIGQMLRDNTLRDFDIKLRRLNIMPGDPLYARMAGGLLNAAMDLKPADVAPHVKQLFDFLPFK